jgi:hypothetical protein
VSTLALEEEEKEEWNLPSNSKPFVASLLPFPSIISSSVDIFSLRLGERERNGTRCSTGGGLKQRRKKLIDSIRILWFYERR